MRRPRLLRRGPGSLHRRARSVAFLVTRDRPAVLRFLRDERLASLPLARRWWLLRRLVRVTNAIRGYHALCEILEPVREILARAGRESLVVAEAGVGSGASTAKLSLAAELAGGHVHAFDSFRGIPDNDEVHENIWGERVVFRRKAFRTTLSTVRRRLAAHGAPGVVTLHRGLLADTLPSFDTPLDVLLLDVDLVSSTRTALVHLFPLLRPDGIAFSQDGHLRATLDLVSDEAFWRDEVGVPPPRIEGMGVRKLLTLRPGGRPSAGHR